MILIACACPAFFQQEVWAGLPTSFVRTFSTNVVLHTFPEPAQRRRERWSFRPCNVAAETVALRRWIISFLFVIMVILSLILPVIVRLSLLVFAEITLWTVEDYSILRWIPCNTFHLLRRIWKLPGTGVFQQKVCMLPNHILMSNSCRKHPCRPSPHADRKHTIFHSES